MGTYFYKIMVLPSAQKLKLRLPEKYVKENEKAQLAKDYVKLRVSDGRVWRVELFKQSGKVWLKKGWEVFVKSYTLKYGHFLLFRYDEADSEFHVTIFNMTGCEIEYDQVYRDYIELAQQVFHITSDNDGMEDHYDNNPQVKVQVPAVDEKKRVTRSLEAFKSHKPHIKRVMQHNNASNQYRLSFPLNHVKEHFKPIKKKQEIIFKRSPDEKSYTLKLNVYFKSRHAQVGYAGWRNFVLDNELHVGDACIFELINPRIYTYKVTIFRAALYHLNLQDHEVHSRK